MLFNLQIPLHKIVKWDNFLLSYYTLQINTIQEVIIIPTRIEIYSKEATDILSTITMYPGILEQQVYSFYPGKEARVRNLLTYFTRQERIEKDENGSLYPIGMVKKRSREITIRSVWLLLDFLSDVEYHCAGNYPITVIFLIKGKEYQILHAQEGYEAIIGASLNLQKDNAVCRIVLVDSVNQISKLQIPGIAGYCTVDADGRICYYKSQS